MKTTYKLSALILSIVLFIAMNVNGSNLMPSFSDEEYIDDIPFDTELIYEQLTMPGFDFEEEAYISDIPLEIMCITPDCKFEKAVLVEFEQEEELFVDDMPFDTEKIVNEYNLKTATSVKFEYEDEEYVDDIPFNTSKVALAAEITLNVETACK